MKKKFWMKNDDFAPVSPERKIFMNKGSAYCPIKEIMI